MQVMVTYTGGGQRAQMNALRHGPCGSRYGLKKQGSAILHSPPTEFLFPQTDLPEYTTNTGDGEGQKTQMNGALRDGRGGLTYHLA